MEGSAASVVAWTVVGVGVAVAYFVFYVDKRWRYRHVPGPVGQPLVGNLPSIAGHGKDITTFLLAAQQKYGPLFRFWYGSRPWVIVGTPEVGRRLLSRLLIRPSVKFIALLDDESQPMLDLSLLGLKGPAWRVARKAFESAIMHKDALALHLEVMEQCVARLLARLARATAAGGGDGAIVNVAPLMGDLTLDVVGSCVFGVAFNTQEKELGKAALLGAGGQDLGSKQQCLPYGPEELVDACHNVFATSKVGGQSRWATLALLLPEWCYEGLRWLACRFPDQPQRVSLHARKVIVGTAKVLIKAWEQDQAAAAAASDGGVKADEQDAVKGGSRVHEKSFLGLLLKGRDLTTGTTLDLQQVIAQIHVFLLAGYETTTTALTFTLYLLAANPEAQRKLQVEVDSQGELLALPLNTPASTAAKGADCDPVAHQQAHAHPAARPELAPAGEGARGGSIGPGQPQGHKARHATITPQPGWGGAVGRGEAVRGGEGLYAVQVRPGQVRPGQAYSAAAAANLAVALGLGGAGETGSGLMPHAFACLLWPDRCQIAGQIAVVARSLKDTEPISRCIDAYYNIRFLCDEHASREEDGMGGAPCCPLTPGSLTQKNWVSGCHQRHGLLPPLTGGADSGQPVAALVPGAGLTAEEVAASFPYACAVLDEAMRLYPPGATALRSPPEDIEVAGHRIPAHTFLYMPIYSYHHDADVWPDVAEFKPERHLVGHPDAMDAAAKASFMPFGHGARSCPGARFAMQEARVALVRMVRQFSFELAPMQEHPVRTWTGLTTTPVGGMWLRVHNRACA